MDARERRILDDIVQCLDKRLTVNDEPKPFTTDVIHCPRCNSNHFKIRFEVLHNAIDEWKWWTICPDKKQPILLKINVDEVK